MHPPATTAPCGFRGRPTILRYRLPVPHTRARSQSVLRAVYLGHEKQSVDQIAAVGTDIVHGQFCQQHGGFCRGREHPISNGSPSDSSMTRWLGVTANVDVSSSTPEQTTQRSSAAASPVVHRCRQHRCLLASSAVSVSVDRSVRRLKQSGPDHGRTVFARKHTYP